MDENSRIPSDDEAGSRELLIGAFIVAIGLAAFRIGYGGGRDIGSMLFN